MGWIGGKPCNNQQMIASCYFFWEICKLIDPTVPSGDVLKNSLEYGIGVAKL